MSTTTLPSTDQFAPEHLARTVCEIDPGVGSHFAVAVILEVLGHNDRTAKEAGWPDLFALAHAVYDRIEFLKTCEERLEPVPRRDGPASDSPHAIVSGVVQQAVWLLMVVMTALWGLSVWAAQGLTTSLARALSVGILGSLIVSGGFHYAMARRLLFYVAQRDLAQAGTYILHALRVGTLAMSAGGLVLGLVVWLASDGNRDASLLAAGYFLLHGNYRVAVVPLLVLHDVAGIVMTTAAGMGLLFVTFSRLSGAGIGIPMEIVLAQFVGLLALWLACAARSRWLVGLGVPVGFLWRSGSFRVSAGIGSPRWRILYTEAAPWFVTGLLYYLFLFGTRPLGWALPRDERLAYEAGADLGMLGIIAVVVAVSWLLHVYLRALRKQLLTTRIAQPAILRAEAVTRFNAMVWALRMFGLTAAVVLLAIGDDWARWEKMSPGTLAVLRLFLIGTIAALPTFLFSFGLLVSLMTIQEAIGVLAAGLALHLGLGLVYPQTALWLAFSFVMSAGALSELAVWRARRAIKTIDSLYYAAF